MNDLNTIISSFSTEDKQRFLNHLEKNNKRKDVKNIALFKHLSDNKLDSKEVCIRLYGADKKNAYHALRKRLYQSIIHYTANNSLEEESSIENNIIKYILASRFFLQQKQYKPAYKVLNKAEIIAKEHHLFALLNEIYSTQIQYSDFLPTIDLNELITKFNKNKKKHQLEDTLNIIYAKVKHTLNAITYKGEIIDFQTILNDLFQEYNINIDESMSFKSLYQLMSIVSFSAFATNDYLKVEPFLISTYKSIISYKREEKQPFYHIQILYMIANTFFRNKKFDKSLHYLNLMYDEMLLHKKNYYNTFKLKHHLVLSLNLNFTNKQEEAIKTLEPLIKIKHSDLESLLDIHLSLIMFYFQKREFKKALHIFSKFYHTDKWYIEKAGIDWVLKKNLTEILLHIELGNIDLVESRLLSFQRHYNKHLKASNQNRAITFIELVKQFYKTPEEVTSDSFKATVKNSFEWVSAEREDIFVMSFYAWLKSKMTKQPIYKTTLEIIQEN
ncbi:hypothetical protein [Seonamhaeicola maritimus]|uniref:hypothetical protein n=1 Tax=Seonamhaeicola maritimus TaxID=2591822 RepID=UPI002495784D|nr:hypothetical protein [Seonamhaeicola maritimus]